MAISKLLITNYFASGTVTSTSAAAALPVTNCQNPERRKVFRSLAQTADQEIFCDLGSARLCNSIFIANLYAQSGGAVTLHEGGTGASPGAYNLVGTLPAVSSDTNLTSLRFNDTTARHWKIKVANGGVSYYMEAGYISLGASVALDEKMDPVLKVGRVDPSVPSASPDGQMSFTTRTHYYRGSISFSFLLEADATRFHETWNAVGNRVPFFFAADTDILNQQWLMRIKGELELDRYGGETPIYRIKFDWEEAR